MSKYKIGICDDESMPRLQLKNYIINYFNLSGESCELYEYTSGESVAAQYHERLDILFLDIQMGEMNGIEAAKEIRRFDEKVCIIFITALSEYAKEGYKVRAFRYLTKPVAYDEFAIEMAEAIHEIDRYKNKQITVKNDSGLFLIDVGDIIYIEVKGRKIWIKTPKGDVLSYDTLRFFEEKLDQSCFFRCHQGYIINLKYVDSITNKNSILMRPDFYIPLSKHRRKEFMKKFTIYLGDIM